jgi:hypothetical protein
VCLIMHILGYISHLSGDNRKSKGERNLIIEIIQYLNSNTNQKFANRKQKDGRDLSITYQKLFELVLGIHGIKIQKKKLVDGSSGRKEGNNGG